MTREEAINIIKSECYIFNPLSFDRTTMVNTALDLAINSLEQEPCEDAISRQAAIDALKNRWKKTRNYEGIGDDIAEECELYLKQLPSAQPERKNGGWRDHQEGDWIYAKCSLCGAVQDSRSNFCPNCGAEMEGEEESE